MKKDDFLALNREIGQCPPDNGIRTEFLKKQFNILGVSTENGYKAVQYFYNELDNKRLGEESIFKGKAILKNGCFSIVDDYSCYFKMTIEGFEGRKELYFPKQPEPLTQIKYSPPVIDLKPSLKAEAVPVVFGILKDFFDTSQQDELERILKTFDDASSKLLFKDNGNRLTDTFKKLKESDFITGCEKEDLTNWIVANFLSVHRKTVKPYLPKTVEKTISGNSNQCKNPLIEIIAGEIQKPKKPYQKPSNTK